MLFIIIVSKQGRHTRTPHIHHLSRCLYTPLLLLLLLLLLTFLIESTTTTPQINHRLPARTVAKARPRPSNQQAGK